MAGNLRDVMEEYCGTLYAVLHLHYVRIEAYEKVAEYGSIIIAHMDQVEFHEFHKSMVYAYHGQALAALGNKTSIGCFHSLALASLLRAHHLAPEDPDFLEQIIYCYFNLRDGEHFISAYEMFEKVTEPGEVRDRVRRFVRERSGEIGVKVTKDGHPHL